MVLNSVLSAWSLQIRTKTFLQQVISLTQAKLSQEWNQDYYESVLQSFDRICHVQGRVDTTDGIWEQTHIGSGPLPLASPCDFHEK